jgi:hypothetical protein
MYYVRCNTRSSGASAKGTPTQALDYITDAHDAERDPSYSHAELAYIARLDPGWKTDLEGGRVPLVGLGSLSGCSDHDTLARSFEAACQPYHDRRGTTGYLSYTFTLPKELSLVAEGHPQSSRQAMYAAVQVALDAAFPGKDYKAVTAIHTRNEAGEVHYHAHVLIGKFAQDPVSGRTYSLNSRSGGNTGKLRLRALKQGWKSAVDAELKARLGIIVTQAEPFARPALTLADGTYVPALTRESRRMLDNHLRFRLSETAPSGAIVSKNFRWTHFDPTIYELASPKRAGGWSAAAFCELFPKLASRLRTYESRVATLKRIGYLTHDGHVTEAFTLHYRVHRGDHPELQKLRADLFKAARAGRSNRGGGGGKGGAGDRSPAERSESRADARRLTTDATRVALDVSRDPARAQDAYPAGPTDEASELQRPPTGRRRSHETGNSGGFEPVQDNDAEVDLWLALHRHQQILKRLERLGVSPEEFKRIYQQTRRQRPTPEVLQQLRVEAKARAVLTPTTISLPRTKGVIRSYCAVQRAQVVSIFVVAKGLLTLRYSEHKAIADRMRTRARLDLFYAREKKLAVAARRLQPLFWVGRILMPQEVHRLELALKRCNQLASRQHADTVFRQQVRIAYRNSREDLVRILKQTSRTDALARDPKLLAEAANLRGRLDRWADQITQTPDAASVTQLRTGVEVLAALRPGVYVDLEVWRGREPDLAAALLAHARHGRETSPTRDLRAAMLAARVGNLLDRENASVPVPLPAALRGHAQEVLRANARLAAVGVPAPFTTEVLQALPAAAIDRALGSLRQAGLLDDGPAWTLRETDAYPVGREVRTAVVAEFLRAKEIDR